MAADCLLPTGSIHPLVRFAQDIHLPLPVLQCLKQQTFVLLLILLAYMPAPVLWVMFMPIGFLSFGVVCPFPQPLFWELTLKILNPICHTSPVPWHISPVPWHCSRGREGKSLVLLGLQLPVAVNIAMLTPYMASHTHQQKALHPSLPPSL